MRVGTMSAGLGVLLLSMSISLRASGGAEADGGARSGGPVVLLPLVGIVRGGTVVIPLRGGIPPFPNPFLFGYTMWWEEVTVRPISAGQGRLGIDPARYVGGKQMAKR